MITVTEQTPAQEGKTELKPLNENLRMMPQYKTVRKKHARKIENKMKNKTQMTRIKISNVCVRTWMTSMETSSVSLVILNLTL